MLQADAIKGMFDAQKEVMAARQELGLVKVWFWRFRSPYSELVPQYQTKLNHADAKLKPFLDQRDALQTKARQSVGIFSEYGVESAREKFWSAVDMGKGIGFRQTMWDALLRMGDRDDGVAGYLIKIIFT